MLLAVSVLLLMSCAGKQKTEESAAANEKSQTEKVAEVQTTPSYTVSNIIGVYTGTLPAASSPGIKTELTLNEDKSYTLNSEFLEETDGKFTEEGSFDIEHNILTITGVEGTVSYYKIEKNQLRMLNMDKQEITGETAELYVLKKTE